MRMRCNKSAGETVNSAISRCVYTRRQLSSGTLKFLQQNPWLTCPERLWLLQTWSTCLALDFVTDKAPPPSSPLVAMTTKASLSVSYEQSVHLPWGLSVAFLPHMHDSLSLSLSTNNPFSFYNKPTFSHIIHLPPDNAWYKNIFFFSSVRQQ